jgi:hypothetical protein
MNYLPEDYENYGKGYVIGSAAEPYRCHLFDGDEFTIQSTGMDSGFKLTYVPKLPDHISGDIGKKCSDFWKSASLNYDSALGILCGIGTDQFGGGGEQRTISIALDRSRRDPFVVHIYVSARKIAAPPPDDGSATGTGKS